MVRAVPRGPFPNWGGKNFERAWKGKPVVQTGCTKVWRYRAGEKRSCPKRPWVANIEEAKLKKKNEKRIKNEQK